MARAFDRLSSQYLLSATTPITGPPHTLAAWIRKTDGVSQGAILSLSDSGGDVDYDGLLILTSEQVQALSRGNVLRSALTTATISLNTWHHVCGVFAASNDRSVYLDGGNKVSNTASVTQDPFDDIGIAVLASNTKSNYFGGYIDEAVIYDVALTDREVWLLAQGKPPWEVRPESLVGLWLPFGDRTDRDFSSRGYHMTATNGPTWTADPPQVVKAWRSNPQYIGRRIVGRESPLAVAVRPFGLSPTAPAVTSILTTYAGYAQPIGA